MFICCSFSVAILIAERCYQNANRKTNKKGLLGPAKTLAAPSEPSAVALTYGVAGTGTGAGTGAGSGTGPAVPPDDVSQCHCPLR